MSEQDADRQVSETIGQRLTTRFTQTVGDEMARAAKKGVPTETVLHEALNALLRMAAVVAANVIAPETVHNREQAQPRIERLHPAFARAACRIMEGESRALERKGLA